MPFKLSSGFARCSLSVFNNSFVGAPVIVIVIWQTLPGAQIRRYQWKLVGGCVYCRVHTFVAALIFVFVAETFNECGATSNSINS
jgi:hypothetical protein